MSGDRTIDLPSSCASSEPHGRWRKNPGSRCGAGHRTPGGVDGRNARDALRRSSGRHPRCRRDRTIRAGRRCTLVPERDPDRAAASCRSNLQQRPTPDSRARSGRRHNLGSSPVGSRCWSARCRLTGHSDQRQLAPRPWGSHAACWCNGDVVRARSTSRGSPGTRAPDRGRRPRLHERHTVRPVRSAQSLPIAGSGRVTCPEWVSYSRSLRPPWSRSRRR